VTDTPSPESSPDTRTRILEAFAELGFSGAGVDEIARRAGVNKAMLYYHVGDKAELYGQVVTGFIAEVRAEIAARVAKADTPTAKLAALQQAFAALALGRPHYPRIMLREISLGGANLPPQAARGMLEVMALTRRIVAEGQASGEFRAVNPVLTHILVVGSVVFFANALRLRARLEAEGADFSAERLEPDEIADRITDILLYGIAARPAGGGQT
jgi:TetR/AcrR family transcriptional regulator